MPIGRIIDVVVVKQRAEAKRPSKKGLTNADVAKHYKDIANLCRTLGEAALPTVAVLDGCVTGAAVGIGAHIRLRTSRGESRGLFPGLF